MRTISKAAIAGGLVAFIWTNISWMVLPWHWTTLGGVENEAPIAEALRNNIAQDGVYILPYSSDHSQDAQVEVHKRMEVGPYAFMVVRPNGLKLSMPKMMVVGLLLHLIAAFIFTFLLSKTTELSALQKAGFVCLMAVGGAMLDIVANWNWWNFPLNFTLVSLTDVALTWFLGGFVIGKLMKARPS